MTMLFNQTLLSLKSLITIITENSIINMTFRDVNQNKLNLLYQELESVRVKIKQTFTTPKNQMSDLVKAAQLEGLRQHECYLLMQIAKQQGILNLSKN